MPSFHGLVGASFSTLNARASALMTTRAIIKTKIGMKIALKSFILWMKKCWTWLTDLYGNSYDRYRPKTTKDGSVGSMTPNEFVQTTTSPEDSTIPTDDAEPQLIELVEEIRDSLRARVKDAPEKKPRGRPRRHRIRANIYIDDILPLLFRLAKENGLVAKSISLSSFLVDATYYYVQNCFPELHKLLDKIRANVNSIK